MKIRKATKEDIEILVGLLADDDLGKTRENLQHPLPASYFNAFEEIEADKNQELMVAENENGEVIGTFQLTFIYYLNFQGALRAQIEAVQIRSDQRGQGIGKKMLEWAIKRAQERNAHILQLTSDKRRPKAIRFYEKRGFKASHEGMKLYLDK